MNGAGERLVLPSDLGRLGDARAWIARRAVEAGFGRRDVLDLELAVTEAVSNVVRHAYREAADGRIELEARDDGDALVIRVRDWGGPFVPPGRGRTEGGYGLELITLLVDSVDRTELEDGTLLELVKHRPGGEP